MKLAVIGTGMIITEALQAIFEVKEIALVSIFGRPHSRKRRRSLL